MERFITLRGKFLYNAFAIPRASNDLEPVAGGEKEYYKQADDVIGAGLYHIASYLSHSCVPNVKLEFEGNKMSLVALENLSKGDELVVSFLSGAMGTKKRRNMIKEKYRFVCKCTGCLSS
jgi:hypothetical protein